MENFVLVFEIINDGLSLIFRFDSFVCSSGGCSAFIHSSSTVVDVLGPGGSFLPLAPTGFTGGVMGPAFGNFPGDALGGIGGGPDDGAGSGDDASSMTEDVAVDGAVPCR